MQPVVLMLMMTAMVIVMVEIMSLVVQVVSALVSENKGIITRCDASNHYHSFRYEEVCKGGHPAPERKSRIKNYPFAGFWT